MKIFFLFVLISGLFSFRVFANYSYEDIAVLKKYGTIKTGDNSEYSDILSVTLDWMSVDRDQLPKTYAIHQNYPNPFNPITTLRYGLPEDAMVNITIYDMMGRIVSTLVNENQSSGYKTLQWNATNDSGQPVSAGVYLYAIKAGHFAQTKKMILLK